MSIHYDPAGGHADPRRGSWAPGSIWDLLRRVAGAPSGAVVFLPGAELTACDGVTRVTAPLTYRLEEPLPLLLLGSDCRLDERRRRVFGGADSRAVLFTDLNTGQQELWTHFLPASCWFSTRSAKAIKALLA